MAITAAMVKELREMTGAGMMDCKKALTETNGDMDAAVDVLKKSGAAKMEKKQSRIAAEGIARVAQGSGCSHGRWAYPFQSGGYYRFPDIVLGAGGSLEEYMMDVGSHQYPIIRSHTEQGDKTDPDCHAQIDRVHLEKIPHILSGDGEVHEPILSVKP